MYAFNAETGAVLWQNVLEGPMADANFAATSVVPGVVFAGGVFGQTDRGEGQDADPHDHEEGDEPGGQPGLAAHRPDRGRGS